MTIVLEAFVTLHILHKFLFVYGTRKILIGKVSIYPNPILDMGNSNKHTVHITTCEV